MAKTIFFVFDCSIYIVVAGLKPSASAPFLILSVRYYFQNVFTSQFVVSELVLLVAINVLLTMEDIYFLHTSGMYLSRCDFFYLLGHNVH